MTPRDPRRDDTDPPPKRVLGVQLPPPAPRPSRIEAWRDWLKGSGSLVVAVIIALGGGTGIAALRTPPPSASSAEVKANTEELKAAKAEAAALRDALAASKFADMQRDIAAIRDQTSQTNANVTELRRQTDLLAEAFTRSNGGPPNSSWPFATTGWYANRNPPPILLTDRQWTLNR